MNQLTPLPSSAASLIPADQTPALVVDSGARAEQRFWEFFTVTIRNPNTRAAYARAAREFCEFVAAGGVPALPQVQPIHVAAYVEALGKTHAPSTVKLRLAAIRHALRLAGHRPGGSGQSSSGSQGATPCGQARQDAGA